MKKARKLFLVCLMAVLALATFMFAACGEKNIQVISREASSGTRGAFEELVSKDGVALEDAELLSNMDIQSGTNDVISRVAANPTAIGYVSLGSVDSSVKALQVNGVTANADNVTNKTYGLARPFVVMTKSSLTFSSGTQDFLLFLKSSAAQDIVEDHGYVTQANLNGTYTAPASAVTGEIDVRGSTSMQELMEALIAEYKEIGGTNVSGITFNVNCQGSGEGIDDVAADTNGGHDIIGMASRELTTDEQAGKDFFNIAKDAIAIIVNPDNELTNITIEQLFDIYTGAITKFSQLTDAE